MKLRVNAVHFTADKKLIDFVETKVKKLTTFYDNIIDAEVFLRLNKSEDASNKVVEIKLNVPGIDLFAKKQNKTFEAATDEAVEALKSQVKKKKTKETVLKHSEL